MKKAVAYARYSTDMQREESIDAQVRAIREYCNRNDIVLLDIYTDEGISGTTDNRPGFQSMIEDSKSGTFDYVIVHKLDRFARNRYDSAVYRKKLETNKVGVISVLENIDNSPESIILQSVLEGMSEYFSKNLSREVKKGMKENALKSQFNGGVPCLGYDIVNKKYVINPYEAQAIKIIFEMYAKGHKYADIINELNSKGYKTKPGNEFKKTSLYEILNNEKYVGTYIFGREDYDGFASKRNYHRKRRREDMIVVENGVEAIISKELWNKVMMRMEDSRHRSGQYKANRVYVLSGLLYCGHCGKNMIGKYRSSNGKKYYYYVCGNPECEAKSVRAEKIESQVIECFNKVLFSDNNKEVIAKAMYAYFESLNVTPDTSALEKELKLVETQISNLMDALMNGLPSESIKEKLYELEQKKVNLQNDIQPMKVSRNLHYNMDEIVSFLNRHKDINKYPPEEQRTIMKMFVNRVEIKNHTITVKLNMISNDVLLNGAGNPSQTASPQLIVTFELVA